MSGLTLRPATLDDLPVLRTLMSMAIAENMKAFLSAELIQASNKVMGLDTLLVEDGTYWIVHRNGEPAGCGGWSRRNTLYGGDHSAGRSPALLDPAVDAARVRAMYTHPSYVRRGIGRLILDHCEMAAPAKASRACSSPPRLRERHSTAPMASRRSSVSPTMACR